jgi:gamma-glutamyl-gamma-aminobutyrate hydrolase PuuD
MHHQCIKVLGQSRVPTVLSIEPVTNTIEEICWGNGILAVQWHPELSLNEVSTKFFNFVKDWASSKKQLVKE